MIVQVHLGPPSVRAEGALLRHRPSLSCCPIALRRPRASRYTPAMPASPDIPSCRQCRYLLTGLPKGPCPECGTLFDPDHPTTLGSPSRAYPVAAYAPHRVINIVYALVVVPLFLAMCSPNGMFADGWAGVWTLLVFGTAALWTLGVFPSRGPHRPLVPEATAAALALELACHPRNACPLHHCSAELHHLASLLDHRTTGLCGRCPIRVPAGLDWRVLRDGDSPRPQRCGLLRAWTSRPVVFRWPPTSFTTQWEPESNTAPRTECTSTRDFGGAPSCPTPISAALGEHGLTRPDIDIEPSPTPTIPRSRSCWGVASPDRSPGQGWSGSSARRNSPG